MKVKVIIADDHSMFRDGVKMAFKDDTFLELIGEASNGEELVDICRSLRPDVVLTDIRMPVLDGVAAAKKLNKLIPSLPIVAFTTFSEISLVNEMIDAGARGYILKSASKTEIRDAIKAVLNGSVYFDKELSHEIGQELIALKKGQNNYENEVTEREKLVIKLICHGKTSKEISDEINLSIRTIENYKVQIMNRLNVNTLAGLIVQSIKRGLIKI
jgi:DNA-binding NarL/FixJ family response regulator